MPRTLLVMLVVMCAACSTRVTDTPLVQTADQRIKETRIPMKRYARPEEIADAVLYLASPKASYVTGEQLFVDGGWSGLSRI